MKLFFLSASVLVFLFLTGCSNMKTNTDILTRSSWNINTVAVDERLYPLDDCFKDDLYEFSDDGVVLMSEGDLSCNDDSSPTIGGEWSFLDEETILHITHSKLRSALVSVIQEHVSYLSSIHGIGTCSGAFDDDYHIEEISKDELILILGGVSCNSISVTFRIIFKN